MTEEETVPASAVHAPRIIIENTVENTVENTEKENGT